ncbi:MAG: hypothetical protein ACKPKO_17730, partial [Candidatus Fonsibacter sp.]
EFATLVSKYGWYAIFCSEGFAKFDAGKLRRHEGERRFRTRGPDGDVDGRDGEEQNGHVCECARRFTSRSALALHGLKVHGVAGIGKRMYVNNQCPWCERAFTTLDGGGAQRKRMMKILKTGRCGVRIGPGRSFFNHGGTEQGMPRVRGGDAYQTRAVSAQCRAFGSRVG